MNNGNEIQNVYATGNVTGSDYVGGLVGILYTGVDKSYSSGQVTSSGSNVGGLIGHLYSAGYGWYALNSYWDAANASSTT